MFGALMMLAIIGWEWLCFSAAFELGRGYWQYYGLIVIGVLGFFVGVGAIVQKENRGLEK